MYNSKPTYPPIYLHLIFATLQFEILSLMNWIFLPAIACKIPVWNRLKIKFIKLDISNWRIAKIECKQIGGKSLAESFAYQEKSPEGCIFGDLSFVIPSRSTTLQKWWLQALSPWVLFPIYFVMHYYSAHPLWSVINY